ncbi:Putative deoxyribonuclease YjjV [hydrothermal vent metagenome]|uniref:Deoxyribonuclease YjjV n=1 Tax=hydrothermal vent metagenome TaxID=652676 RepID=A0A3B1ATG5_9ZZZZ
MQLIDTHCHLDVAAFDTDRDALLGRVRTAGVSRIVVPGITAAAWEKLLALCANETGLYPALGLHPMFLDRHHPDDLQVLETLIALHKPVAVGEIGLDFYLPGTNREQQKALFKAQLHTAHAAGLPVLLHVRKAHDETLALLRKTRVCGGICHAFNGSLQQARQYIALGFKLGFGGMLTYQRSHKLHRLARELPLDSMVLESDAPDMPPANHHGQRNSPEYLPEILRALARLREEDSDTIAVQTTANAIQLLKLAGAPLLSATCPTSPQTTP